MLRNLLGAQPITTPIDRKVLPLDEAMSSQFVEQRYILGRRPGVKVQATEAIGPVRPLRDERLRHRMRYRHAAKQRDELAPFHSITSSARSSRDVGTSMPITFALLRLTI